MKEVVGLIWFLPIAADAIKENVWLFRAPLETTSPADPPPPHYFVCNVHNEIVYLTFASKMRRLGMTHTFWVTRNKIDCLRAFANIMNLHYTYKIILQSSAEYNNICSSKSTLTKVNIYKNKFGQFWVCFLLPFQDLHLDLKIQTFPKKYIYIVPCLFYCTALLHRVIIVNKNWKIKTILKSYLKLNAH